MSFEAFLGELHTDADRRRVTPPPGAVDCDVNIVSNPAKGPSKKLAEHTPEAYREVQETLGLTRVVLIQPDALGFDNSTLCAALDALSKSPDGLVADCVRAFCIVRPGIEAAELEDLTDAGVSGMRLTMLRHRKSCRWDEIDRHVRRVQDLTGWNIELAIDSSDLHEIEQMVRAWPGNIILPDIGGFRFSRSLMQPGFRALRHLIDKGHVWVKLSAPYVIAKNGDPDDPEVNELAAALVAWAPDRIIWGSAWPHLNWPKDAADLPEDLHLLEALGAWTSDKQVRDRILRENPETLYGFEPWPIAQ